MVRQVVRFRLACREPSGYAGGMDLKRRISSAYRKGAGTSDESATPAPGPAAAAAVPSSPAAKPARPAGQGTAAIKTVVPAKPAAKPSHAPGGSPRPAKADIARYLLALGQDEAARILSHLAPEEVEGLAREIAAIEHITAAEARETLERFQGLVKEGVAARGGVDTARTMLQAAFGDSRAERILAQAMPSTQEAPFAFLKDEDPERLVQLLRSEAPGVKAIVLAHLEPVRSAAILGKLDQKEQKDLVIRLSRMQKVEKEVLDRIEQGLRDKLASLGTVADQQVDGTSSLAAIMRHLDPDLEQRLLESLEDEVPGVAEDIRERLFTVDTILLIEDRDLQRVLNDLENHEIALFLKGKGDALRKKLLVNVSTNRAQLILDEYTRLGPQRKADVDTASRDLILRLRRLEQEGSLRVRRKEDEFVE